MADPIIVRTLKSAIGLRSFEHAGWPEAIAIYGNQAGTDVLMIERRGVRILPDQRFIAYRDIEVVKLDPRVKQSVEARRIFLVLPGPETVEIAIDGQSGQFLDVFAIHAFIRRRTIQQRSAKLNPVA